MKPGDIVMIYLNWKEEQKPEGFAKLIEKVEDGDSFYREDERLYYPVHNFDREEMKVDKSRPSKVSIFDDYKEQLNDEEKRAKLTKAQIKSNNRYNKLHAALRGKKSTIDGKTSINPALKALNDELKKSVTASVENVKVLSKIIDGYRFKQWNPSDSINMFFKKFSNDEIVRFAQQEYIKGWTPTIFKGERWKVEFYGPQFDIETKKLLQHSKHVANRWIRTTLCVAPNESPQISELVYYTTYNGKSNFTSKLGRDLTKLSAVEDSVEYLRVETRLKEIFDLDETEPSADEILSIEKEGIYDDNDTNSDNFDTSDEEGDVGQTGTN